MRLSIGFSLSFVRQAMAWDANLLDLFCELVAEGRPWVMGWRESTHLYTYSDEAPYPVDIVDVTKSRSSRRSRQKESGENEREAPPYLLPRHWQLSDDVGYRFSNRNWDNYPLYADTYASWIANTSGDFVLLGWDFETFGEHHRQDTGIFEFMHALPSELAQHGVTFQTPSNLIERYGNAEQAYHLPLPVFPATWAGSGNMEFFLGNDPQRMVGLRCKWSAFPTPTGHQCTACNRAISPRPFNTTGAAQRAK